MIKKIWKPLNLSSYNDFDYSQTVFFTALNNEIPLFVNHEHARLVGWATLKGVLVDVDLNGIQLPMFVFQGVEIEYYNDLLSGPEIYALEKLIDSIRFGGMVIDMIHEKDVKKILKFKIVEVSVDTSNYGKIQYQNPDIP